MQLTPTVSSSSTSSYLTSQFQFHDYNPTWFLDLTRQLKAKEALYRLNEQGINDISLEYCRTVVDKFPNEMLHTLDQELLKIVYFSPEGRWYNYYYHRAT